VDPPDRFVPGRPPRDARAPASSRDVVFLMLLGGAWSTIVNLVIFGGPEGGRPAEKPRPLPSSASCWAEFARPSPTARRLSTFFRRFANRWLNLAILWGWAS
jgi:Ca2+-transporting ATPase